MDITPEEANTHTWERIATLAQRMANGEDDANHCIWEIRGYLSLIEASSSITRRPPMDLWYAMHDHDHGYGPHQHHPDNDGHGSHEGVQLVQQDQHRQWVVNLNLTR